MLSLQGSLQLAVTQDSMEALTCILKVWLNFQGVLKTHYALIVVCQHLMMEEDTKRLSRAFLSFSGMPTNMLGHID